MELISRLTYRPPYLDPSSAGLKYIPEALHLLDLRSESVKREMPERTLGEQALRQIRELSWSLPDKLHLVTTQLEYSSPAQLPIASAK